MKKKETFLAAVILLLLVLCACGWMFIGGVNRQLWINSVRTITESTHQGAGALNIQFSEDFKELNIIWENIVHTDSEEAENVLQMYNIIEPDVKMYPRDGRALREDAESDEAVCAFLEKNDRDRGILDAHISSVTGEEVFDIFVRIPSEGEADAYLVKEYRTKEIASRFTLSSYDGSGFSYLVNRNGDIMVRSANADSDKIVGSLFDMICGERNSEKAIELFKSNIRQRSFGWEKFICEKTGMVFCYEALEAIDDWLLVSVIPEEIITGQAHSILRKAMIFTGVSAGIVLIIVGIFYGIKMRENEKHTRELRAALGAADMANQAKSRFLMNMSHDIRTPLNAIIGLTAVAQENIGNPEKMGNCLEKIKSSGIYLLSMVSDVMDMSQIEQGRMILKEEMIRLPQLFGEVVVVMREKALEAGLTMDVKELHLLNKTVAGDPLRIRQILLNIINNAIKYTPSGGHVELELTQAEGLRDSNGVYRFRCTDTGIGMEAEFLDKLFLPFERARNTTASKIPGTGVGLAISKSLLDLMGGDIFVESEPGKGSTFTVEFYLKILGGLSEEDDFVIPKKEAVKEEVKEREIGDYRDKRVLLVEDNELNLEIAEELIGITGAQVETACDGQEAVRMVSESPCGYYDLIFMDIQMPVMDGFEATRRIREMDREDTQQIPIFALSANALAEDIQNSLQAGMNGHVAKPIDLDSIEKVFRQVF